MSERLQLVLQAGHVGRTRGATGSVGPLGTEQQFTLKTATYCQKWLTLRGWTCEVIGADEAVPDSHVFVAIHHDGSRNRDARGPSVGYPSDYRQRSENAAQEWKREFGKHYPGGSFRPDNYTSGLRGYYAYRKTNASVKLVCEHGFGSNLADARFMWSDEGQNAAMHAIEAVLGHWLGWDARASAREVHERLNPGVPYQDPKSSQTTEPSAQNTSADASQDAAKQIPYDQISGETEQEPKPGSEGQSAEMPSDAGASGEADALAGSSVASQKTQPVPPAGSGPATVHPVSDDVKQRAGHTAWQSAVATAVITSVEHLDGIDPADLPSQAAVTAAIATFATLFSVLKTWRAGRRK